MTAEDIRIGQTYVDVVNVNDIIGIFLIIDVDHDLDYRYVTYKKLWLWHINADVTGRKSQGGSPWECGWSHELLA